MLTSISYGGYSSTAICGGCGSENRDLDGWFHDRNHRQCEENMETVRREWRSARTLADERADVRANIEAEMKLA